MASPFQQLRAKLSELFQLEAAAELDFGIYRILNSRRTEITHFLDGLESEVSRVLEANPDPKTAALQDELKKVEAGLRLGGFEEEMIQSAPKVKELRAQLATAAPTDPALLQHELFSHLTTFFSRYYKDGDFLSLRRYKGDTYAIPYQGEEVKLHWANADQYYIKSAENFRDYTFMLGSREDGVPPPRVSFKLIQADTERDNTKAVAGQERRFIYHSIVSRTEDHLVLGFEYRPLTEAESGGPDTEGEEGEITGKKKKKKVTQATLNQSAVETILKESARGSFTGLAAPMPTEKNKTRTLLEKRLADYTARNTFDYFIHKDLGGFLRRELDFYLKNEVLHLDDLEKAGQDTWDTARQKMLTLRAIAHRIIRFLAQIEDFQRKLWLKKKFVVGCDYVLTLDRIPESLYPEIAACEAQREEWVRLFGIDEITEEVGKVGYSVPLTVAFLKENQGLVVDTLLLGPSLSTKIRPHIGADTSLAVRSVNSQALSVMMPALRNKVGLGYIDPPYNTGGDSFIYRDGFQSSSWNSMVQQSLSLAPQFLNDGAALFVSIDDNEVHHLRLLLEQRFGKDGFVANIVWQKRYAPDVRTAISDAHEHILVFGKSPEEFKKTRNKLPLTDFQRDQFRNPDNDERGPWKSDNFTAQGYRPNQMYEITLPSGRVVTPPSGRCWTVTKETFNRLLAEKRMYFGSNGEGLPAAKRFLSEMDGMVPWTWWEHEEAGHSQAGLKETMELFGRDGSFVTAKPTKLIGRIVTIGSSKEGVVLDFFAGSGTTGHAVINLNREDDGNRKYILIEMGEHFDTVLVPRLKKVIYSKDWKEGKPVDRTTGISHCFKVLRLESYEDTLNNLRLNRSAAHEGALKLIDADQQDEYRLGYMLDVEAEGSASLLNVSAFTDPWDYTLDIASGSAGETRPTKVDLVETYHWLIGLTVTAQRFVEPPKSRKKGSTTTSPMLSISEGTNPAGERVLVIWRKQDLMTSKALNEWLTEDGLAARLGEFTEVHVNGDHHLDLLRQKGQTWTARLIDDLFPKLMWEGAE